MDYRIIPQSEWGGVASDGPVPAVPSGLKRVFIHHSVSKAPEDHLKCRDAVLAIDKYHTSHEYNDIAYSFVICVHGFIYEGRGWGKKQGATNTTWNPKSYAICFLGNFQTDVPTLVALNAARWLIANGRVAGWLTTTSDVWGHRDVTSTACPGKHLYAKLDFIEEDWVATKSQYQVHDPNGVWVGGFDTFDEAAVVVAAKVSANRNQKYSIQRVVVNV